MKRYHRAVLCAAAVVGALALTQAILAQVQQAQKAPKDLATLVQSGDSKAALERIRTGADVNQAQPDGTTPLIWAVTLAEYDVAEALIAKKANVNATNAFGVMPLTEAARQSNARLVKMLLAADAKVNSADPDGETALMKAINGGDVSVVQMLIDAGANVNTVEKFHNQTPLMYAAASTRSAAPIVKLLLAKGADVKPQALFSDWPSQVTSEPRTQYRPVGGLDALLYATRGGCYECVEDLIAAGADMNRPTPEGITPLMIALDNEHNEVAKFLIDKGANLNVWDWWGRTALWIAVDRKPGPAGAAAGGGFGGGAARGGAGGGRGGGRGGPGGAAPARAAAGGPARPAVSSMDIINVLLNAGVDVNPEMDFHRPNAPGRGRFGDNQISTATTPLFRAVQNNDMDVILALLAKGADPNLNTMGYTPFLLAAGAGPGGRGAATQPNTQILDVLIQHSADVNAKVTGTNTYSFNVSRENLGNHDALSKEGSTSLHEAARSARTDLVKYLLDHGANPNMLDAAGKKPIDVIGVQRAARGGAAPAAGAAVAQLAVQGQAVADLPVIAVAPVAGAAPAAAPGRGAAGRGGAAPGRGGPNPAAIAEIRTMLEAAASKK